ncbi:unnamed protein product [Toxocara canis]|uniref:Uncharacterized protein n=1 Tax=Toxocara canis TaxID=6265 RepID=A0A183UDV2_TOXCA|nr:unnamed protein product [Toxocara canis]
MPPSRYVVGNCEVCDEASRGYHFGVIVCRACAAFFRRTVALRLKYKCRFEGHCVINKSVRCMCRECRYKKCLEVGMNVEAVQRNRDTIGRTSNERMSVIIDNSPSSCPRTPPVPESPRPSQHDIMMAKVNNIFEYATVNNESEGMSILDAMLQGYHHLLALRSSVHANAIIHPVMSATTAEEKERSIILNCETFVRMTKDEVELTARMVTYFRPFLSLPCNERMNLFERFWMHFLKLERAYATFRQLGDDISDERIVLFNNYITQREQCLPVLASLSNMDRTVLERLFSTSYELTRYSVFVPLKRLKPTEYEFIAICGHMLWTAPGQRGITPETHDIARETRLQIFSDLHRYYTEELKLYNYAPRIGEFMALVSAVERSVAQKKEDAIIIDLFDVFRLDKSFFSMFR